MTVNTPQTPPAPRPPAGPVGPDSAARHVRLAVDIGGTFVDAVAYDGRTGEVRLHKASTTPEEPARGVLNAVSGLIDDLAGVDEFVHGTTLGLNAVLQRRGADVGVITNEGFRDVLEIARGDVPGRQMYNFTYRPPAPLVPRRHRVGVPGRIDAQGREVVPLDESAVAEAARYLVEECGLRSLAICFLHSYLDPSHEQRAAEIVRRTYPDVLVSISSDVTREYREYERTSTVVLDAYIRPVLGDYLSDLERRLAASGLAVPLHIMRSGGGAMTAQVARRAPLATVLSGPAGGIVGAAFLARELGWDRVISFDVGGTSVDACVIDGGVPGDTYEAAIDGFPLLMPIFDIRTIGAGGGSIAWLDDGLLKVGPQSAGAVPGPVCYGGGGTEPTLTDAAMVLGYLDPGDFLGGAMTVDADAARRAVEERVAQPLGLSVTEAAAGVFRVLLARTVGALREITVERGLDPREFTLLAFGGAGGLLAAMLTREMGLRRCVVPRAPGAFSAWGMLNSDLEYDFATTVLRPLDDTVLAELAGTFEELERQGDEVLAAQGVEPGDRTLIRRYDLRYRGQEHTLAVEAGPDDDAQTLLARFHALHRARFGHELPEPGEILTIRVRAVGRLPKPPLVPLPAGDGTPPVPSRHRDAYDVATGRMGPFAVYHRAALAPGHSVPGPAVVEEGTSTTVIFSDQVLTVDAYGQLEVTS